MARSRWLAGRVPLVVGVVVLALIGVPETQAIGTYPLNPTANIPLPNDAFGAECLQRPAGSACETIMIRALNHGRAVLHQPAYSLPSRFRSLTGGEQLLVLSNLDRKLYGRPPVTGLNKTLNASARYGATHDADPLFVSVGGQRPVSGASNWAAGLPSPLAAYYLWMYHDANPGPGEPAWVHRDNVLRQRPVGTFMAVGIGHGTGSTGQVAWTALFESFLVSPSIQFVPTVTLMSSHTGPRAGGATVRIGGFGFVRVTTVTFGGTPARFTVDSAFVIHAVAPAHQAGNLYVRVTTLGGTSMATGAAAYRYG